MNKLGEYIRKQRKRKQLTLRELEKISGVSYSHISQIERSKGRNNKEISPSVDTLKKLALGLGLDQNELVNVAVSSGENVIFQNALNSPEQLRGVDRAETWATDELKSPFEKYKNASPEERERRWREATEQFNSLSDESREAIAVIIKNLAASQK
jgi:transcriptional regulator with XRE-family HTH domain